MKPFQSLLLLGSLLTLTSAQLDSLMKKAGKKYFGTAVDTNLLSNETLMSILTSPGQFGQITPENGQKWIFIEPEQGVFNWTEGTFVTDLATKDLHWYLRCHTLVWHSQLASWVEATNWTADAMREMLWNHVYSEARHWRGQCYAWDVVNEALNEDGTYRETIFYNVLGEEYIKLAFRAAAAADPFAKLYYNDYNLESPGNKSEGVARIVNMLKDEGIKIDGVGMQAHLIAGSAPTIDQEIAVMNSYADLGMEVALTELDIRIELPLTDENLEAQKQDYANVVGACMQVDACVGVTVWGFYDPLSWVPDVFEGQGAATLWFANYTKHPAYYGVVDAINNATCDDNGHGSHGKGKGKGGKGKEYARRMPGRSVPLF